jgi:hypothetical protein
MGSGQLSKEHRDKIAKAMKGHKVSVETRQKLSVAAKRRMADPKERARISSALTGRQASDETKGKMARAHKGVKFTKEHRKRIGEARRKWWTDPVNRAKLTGRKYSQKRCQAISEGLKRYYADPDHSSPSLGKVFSEEHRRKIGRANSGEKSYLWKGGITSEVRVARNSMDYKLWRKEVFERDDYTCQRCGRCGGELEAHHVKSFAEHPELRFVVDNGLTYCVRCHAIVDPERARTAGEDIRLADQG